jgi:hypothetical protein
MRWFLGSAFGIFLLFGCSDLADPPPSSFSSPPSVSTASELFDGSSSAEGANPHFFFLSPLVQSPTYSGVADDEVMPVVTVCNVLSLNSEGKCDEPVAVFSIDAPNEEDRVTLDPGAKYSVVWKSSRYPATPGESFRITVSVLDRALGWIEVKSYPPGRFRGFRNTGPDGTVAIHSRGAVNIAFRIEEGALEAAFCDRTGIEDCDVAFFDPQTGGTLRVFETPESFGSPLGAEVRVPAGAQVEGPFAVILTLEQEGVTQSGTVPPDQQVPYFVDLRTEPPGITFDRNAEGVNIVLCQLTEGSGAIPESLHDFLVIFLTRTSSSGQSTRLLPTTPGNADCDGFEPHSHTATLGGSSNASLLDRLVGRISRVTGLFLPKPLMARRLHGGLNTVVWEISGDDLGDSDGRGSLDPDGPANVSGLTFSFNGSGEEGVLEFGAMLDVHPGLSAATVEITDPAVVDSETTVTVQILDAAGIPFPLELIVRVSVAGANETGTLIAEYLGNSLYEVAYTPTQAGTDSIKIEAWGPGILDLTEIGTFISEVHPLSGDMVVVVEISGGAPADGLPVILYQGTSQFGVGTTGSCSDAAPGVSSCSAVFADIEFGSYTAHLPKRDFDVQFVSMTKAVTHDQAHNSVAFTGVTQAIPAEARVFRVRESDGTGNAYQYMVGGRSWVASNNEVQNDVLLGVQGHLATIHSTGENHFVTGLVSELCPNVDRRSACKSQGWIGLRKSSAGAWEWVTDEAFTYSNWDAGFPSTKNNQDHVEINPTGFWRNINGARSTNDGYVVEWSVTWPATPPPLGDGE